MTTTGNSPDPLGVDHPIHYNVHPSGVEAIDLCEHLSFNTGNAVKCLFRAGLKGAAAKDLDKAIWYLNRELDHSRSETHGRFSSAGSPHQERCSPLALRYQWDGVIVTEVDMGMRRVWANIARGDIGEALRLIREIRDDLPSATP